VHTAFPIMQLPAAATLPSLVPPSRSLDSSLTCHSTNSIHWKPGQGSSSCWAACCPISVANVDFPGCQAYPLDRIATICCYMHANGPRGALVYTLHVRWPPKQQGAQRSDEPQKPLVNDGFCPIQPQVHQVAATLLPSYERLLQQHCHSVVA